MGYERLHEFLETLEDWAILPWTSAHADEFRHLRSAKVRIGSMDLKIAVTAQLESATVLTRNERDFACVPGLIIENWLE
jgi:tRNA(fMet)-specific endonuclease VapC